MAKAEHSEHSRAHKSYAKRISDHVAIALVAYTLALIFVTSPAMESKGTSILPYFMLVVFVAMVIPACRNMEHRWVALEATELGDGGLETRFTLDRIKLWVAALAIPILLAVVFTIF
jgi:cell division protein FtsW (lipid II flippase)